MTNTSSTDIKLFIEREVYYITDPRMDGFTTWARKQNLYELKFYLEEMIKRCPKYAPEDEWLEEQTMLRVQKILEGNTLP
jgi:hypothetical protein